MLRELKVFLDQLERDVLRAQGAEGNLTDKYQVTDLERQAALLQSRRFSTWTLSLFYHFVLQAFKSFSVQYEMKKKQTDPLLQPVHRDGKLSVDQALVKQAWDRVSARVSVLQSSAKHE